MRLPQAPLFQDPIFNGAADPTIIWNKEEQQWWILYTQRRANGPGPGGTNVHGSDIGIASSPDGYDWVYRGVCEGLNFEHGRNTFWAPEVIYHEGLYHMYVSYITGMPTHWQFPRDILHYTSTDLWVWHKEGRLPLASPRVIDACVARIAPNHWRMWYKNEDDHSYSHYADSHDLYNWENMGRAVTYTDHEGPNVFFWQGQWWYIGDFWRGQGCFRSSDCLSWEFTGYILDKPGSRPGDGSMGNHADVLVLGEEAYVLYFSHTAPPEGWTRGCGIPLPEECKRLSVQVARLTTDGKSLFCDRDEAFDFVLPNGDATLGLQ